jgi:hypothetical protein
MLAPPRPIATVPGIEAAATSFGNVVPGALAYVLAKRRAWFNCLLVMDNWRDNRMLQPSLNMRNGFHVLAGLESRLSRNRTIKTRILNRHKQRRMCSLQSIQ